MNAGNFNVLHSLDAVKMASVPIALAAFARMAINMISIPLHACLIAVMPAKMAFALRPAIVGALMATSAIERNVRPYVNSKLKSSLIRIILSDNNA